MPKERGGGIQRPFEDLEQIVRRAGIGAKPSPATKPPEPPPAPAIEQTSVSDDELFLQAMQNVVRPGWRQDCLAVDAAPPQLAADPEQEGRKLMQDAVNGIPALSVLDHPEYIEGWVGVAGRRFLPNLRSGLYSIQGQVDLHGLGREEARERVEQFIQRMSRFRSCCVKIIHGRGINSPHDRAILKEQLQRWLSTRRLSRHVVAYASAPFNDGGVGAVYVLLRRN